MIYLGRITLFVYSIKVIILYTKHRRDYKTFRTVIWYIIMIGKTFTKLFAIDRSNKNELTSRSNYSDFAHDNNKNPTKTIVSQYDYYDTWVPKKHFWLAQSGYTKYAEDGLRIIPRREALVWRVRARVVSAIQWSVARV